MAKINRNRALTAEELKTLAQVSKDPFAFASNAYVVDPVIGKVQFDLYPYQRAVLLQFLLHRFNIILKARQMGITELLSLFSLWMTMYHPNKRVNIISIKDTIAKKVLRRIKFMYKNLPWYLQIPIINGQPGNFGSTEAMEFINGSLIESIPTSEQAGRSESLSLLIIDEAAAVRWANQIWAAAAPALSTGGSAVINSCVTGDTEIVGQNGNFRIEQVCPREFGVQDIQFMNLHVLTHKLRWKKVLYSVNKGVLKTWEILDSEGDRIKCTPAHKFLTPQGWKSAEEIVNKSLYIVKHHVKKVEPYPHILPPDKEIWKTVGGFPNYQISNFGRIRIKKTQEIKTPQDRDKHKYTRIHLHIHGEDKHLTISRLVAEHFIGDIPKGYVVDHINGNIKCNWVTNLQIISPSENTERSVIYARGSMFSGTTGRNATDVELVSYIKYLHLKGKSYEEIIKLASEKLDRTVNVDYIRRIIRGKRVTNITLAKLKIVREYEDHIYDITVEDDESYITTSNYISHNTPLGTGGWYHSTWIDAVAGVNGFNPIRLFWDMHPNRDQAWYESMSKALGAKRTAQEIDGDFLSSGNTVFDLTDIKAIDEALSEYRPIRTRFNRQYQEFLEPDPNKSYFIGADCATGRSEDYSAFTCMDASGEEHAVFKGRIALNQYAKLLGEIGQKFNFAKIAPETNDIGMAATIALQDEGYPNLYYTQHLLKKKGQSRPTVEEVPGWLTTNKNRSVIIEDLERDIREDNIIVKDPFFVQEAYTFIYDGTGRPVAMGKHRRNSSVDIDLEGQTYADDAIFGKAITNHIRKTPENVVVLPV